MVAHKGLSEIVDNDNLPRIVNAICITLVLLAIIYVTYSYLLTTIAVKQQPLTLKLERVQEQLKTVQTQRQNLIEEKAKLMAQLKKQNQEIISLQAQRQQKNPVFPASTQVCTVEPENLNESFINKALRKTLSRKPLERIEGFSILMNNLDYMDSQLQNQVVQFYLAEINPKNRDGVYYATFILSELRPDVLKRYEFEIDEALYFIHEDSDWQKTLHKYCGIENKLNSSTVGTDTLAQH